MSYRSKKNWFTFTSDIFSLLFILFLVLGAGYLIHLGFLALGFKIQ